MIFQPASNIQVPFMQPQWRRGRAAAGGGGGVLAFSDNFTGDGDISARALTGGTGSWVEANGSLDTSAGVLRAVSGSFAKNLAVVGTDCGSATQYLCVTIPTISGTIFPHLVMRYVDASSGYYSFEMAASDGNWSWYKYDSAADTSGTQIGGIINLTHASGDKWGVTITGTGASTEVRIWKNPTANTPVSATEWDSGDTTPDGLWTDDPGANACDSGQKLGMKCFASAANSAFADNFFAGGL